MKTIDQLTDDFLRWPLPESVWSDLCVTMSGYKGRVGTNLLSAVEAKQMLQELVMPSLGEAQAELARLHDQIAEYERGQKALNAEIARLNCYIDTFRSDADLEADNAKLREIADKWLIQFEVTVEGLDPEELAEVKADRAAIAKEKTT